MNIFKKIFGVDCSDKLSESYFKNVARKLDDSCSSMDNALIINNYRGNQCEDILIDDLKLAILPLNGNISRIDLMQVDGWSIIAYTPQDGVAIDTFQLKSTLIPTLDLSEDIFKSEAFHRMVRRSKELFEMVIYLSGPISGVPLFVAEASFEELEQKARTQFPSAKIVNPIKELLYKDSISYEEYMRVDIASLSKCTHIYMMKGWNNSKGAKNELNIARDIFRMEVIYED